MPPWGHLAAARPAFGFATPRQAHARVPASLFSAFPVSLS
jgi:hypothetical protein